MDDNYIEPPKVLLTLEEFFKKVEWRLRVRNNEHRAQALMNLLYILKPQVYEIIYNKEAEIWALKDKTGKSSPERFNGPDIYMLTDEECVDSNPKYKLFMELVRKHWDKYE